MGGGASAARGELNKKYKINKKKELGKGGFASVFKAVEKGTTKEWAVKIIKRNDPRTGKPLIDEKYLQTEIKILHGLGTAHQHILTLQDYYEAKEELLLVLELAGGGTLLERIDKRGAFNEELAALVMRQLCDATQFLHDHKVIHRDMKVFRPLARSPARPRARAPAQM